MRLLYTQTLILLCPGLPPHAVRRTRVLTRHTPAHGIGSHISLIGVSPLLYSPRVTLLSCVCDAGLVARQKRPWFTRATIAHGMRQGKRRALISMIMRLYCSERGAGRGAGQGRQRPCDRSCSESSCASHELEAQPTTCLPSFRSASRHVFNHLRPPPRPSILQPSIAAPQTSQQPLEPVCPHPCNSANDFSRPPSPSTPTPTVPCAGHPPRPSPLDANPSL